MKTTLTILFFFALFLARAQQPEFTWGSPINRDPRQLHNMDVVGVDDDGFFATYKSDGQITLEHFSPENVRLWTTALLPKAPDGKSSTFHSVQMIKGTLYMISSSTQENGTSVYAQEIRHNGNYSPKIVTIAHGKFAKQILVSIAQDEAALIVVMSGENKQEITSALLTDKLVPRWTMTLTSEGDAKDVLVHPDGTTYLLTMAKPASPSTSALYLYRLKAKTGETKEMALGHNDYRPYKAKLTATPEGETIVAGYMIPSSYVASHNPEPVGTFYYRLNNERLNRPIAHYAPFRPDFVQTYKRFKPDNDQSQRLRHLHLDRLLPTDDAGVILIGEVCYQNNRAGFSISHNNDLIITRLRNNGSQAYITSTNKLQTSTQNDRKLHSYFATAVGDTLKIIYLHFEYTSDTNSNPDSPSKLSSRTPVMVTLLPDGSKQIVPLKNPLFGRAQDFHLCPTSAFQTSEREFIILGLGEGYYRYGRMSFK